MQNDLIKNIISDLKVDLTDEFDRNFERKAFFDAPWPETKRAVRRGTLLMRTGALRQSIMATATQNGISFTSSLNYAALHNDGGIINVTVKVKKFFWAMYYQAVGSITKRKNGSAARTQKNQAANSDAQYWKSLALLKVGTKLKVPQRQFIGHHKEVDFIIRLIIEDHIDKFITSLNQKLK